jgi:peroxiredoxin
MIEWLNLGARLALAAIFAIAAVSKLSDQEGVTVAVRQLLRSNERTARVTARVLPVVELALALLLVPATTAVGAALTILALLLVFTVLLATSLRRGEHVQCNCFGVLSTRPVSRRTIGRNVILICVAAFVAVTSSVKSDQIGLASIADAIGQSNTDLAVAILGALFILQGVGLLLLFVQYRNLRTMIGTSRSRVVTRGLQAGDPLPDFELINIDGRTFRLQNLVTPSRGALLVFSHPLCSQCNAVLPLIGYAHALGGQGPVVAVVTQGSEEENRAKAEEHGLPVVLMQGDAELAQACRVTALPAAILVDGGGLVAHRLVTGADAVRALLLETNPSIQEVAALLGGELIPAKQ